MKAIILAAGFGTRLRPLTDSRPKALVKIVDKPLLKIVIQKLYSEGFDEIYINVHAFADQVEHFIKNQHFQAKITLFHEKEILDTGGGIRNIVKSLSTDEPVLVHNVDVLTDLDLGEFYNQHVAEKACISLAIQDRLTKRYLVFDKKNQLCGRGQEDRKKANLIKQPEGEIGFYGFNGIQIISPYVFMDYFQEKFKSIDLYLQLAAEGRKVFGFQMKNNYWRDLGKPDDLKQVETDIKKGLVALQ